MLRAKGIQPRHLSGCRRFRRRSVGDRVQRIRSGGGFFAQLSEGLIHAEEELLSGQEDQPLDVVNRHPHHVGRFRIARLLDLDKAQCVIFRLRQYLVVDAVQIQILELT